MKTFRPCLSLLCLGIVAASSWAQTPIQPGPSLPPGATAARPGDGLPGETLTTSETEALLKEAAAFRRQLLDERREALRRAAQTATLEEKQKIMSELASAQQAQLAEKGATLAKARAVEKQRQEAQRAVKPATESK